MENTELELLIQKHLNRTLNPEERAKLDAWYLDYAYNSTSLMDETVLVQKLMEMDNAFPFTTREPVSEISKYRRLWARLAGTAAVVSLIISGIYFFKAPTRQATTSQFANDIKPGTVGATLTLANGNQIKLSGALNGEIAQEAGISVTKTADGQLVYEMKETAGDPNKTNRLSTAKGETYILTLPDKSKVWLNSASSLTYAATLNRDGVRRVKLEGEAYFEIVKDKSHPFVVESNGQEVEVLGTHFNVNGYGDEPAIATTLLEGSVKVTNRNLKEILKPGQQAVNNGSTIKVAEVNTENIIAWKDGGFALSGEDFKAAMNKIARWYDVEVIYDSSVPDELEAGGWISRNNKLSAVLKLIESSGQVRFKIEGRKIYVSK